MFNYKTKIAGKTLACPGNEGDVNQPAVPNLNHEFTILLRYISSFWRFLDLPLINYETELDLSWGKDGVSIEHHNNITGVNYMINSTIL